VLVDACELAGEIDVAAARVAEGRAREELGGLGLTADAAQRERLQAELAWARNLLAVAERGAGRAA
jgi:hypothetical protein